MTDVGGHAEDTIATILARGGELRVAGGRLRVRGPESIMDDKLRAALRAQRDEIIARLGARRVLPLAGVQRRLWFLQQVDASGVGYAIAFAYRLTGPLDLRSLDTALRATMAAHPGLRAGFAEVGGTPTQFIADDVPVTSAVVDCRGLPAVDTHKRLREHLMRPFDLSHPPLVRSAVARTGDDEWLWGLAYHHLVADGWTHALVVRAVCAAYRDAALPPPAADYPDFVAAERTTGQDPRRAAALERWAGVLGAALSQEPGEILPDFPRPPVRSHRGGRVDTRIDATVAGALRSLATAEQTTLFAVLLGVHAAVVAKHSGTDTVIVGTPQAARPEARFHDVAGCFVDTVVLPVDLGGGQTFRELVRRTAATSLDAWDHEGFSYERLVDRLAPERDTSRNALFQTFLALQDIPVTLDLPGIAATPVAFDSGAVQFDLEYHVTPGPDGSLGLTVLFNRDLFERATAETLAARWVLLAQRLVALPDLAVSAVDARTSEDATVIATANKTTMAYPHDTRADELFAAQVAKTPDRTALHCGMDRLTYRDLDGMVDALATRLAAAGGIGKRVGLLLPRSPALVAALLATMRAGGTFVPFNINDPAERIRGMCERSGVALAWTAPDTARLLPPTVRRLDTAVMPGATSLPEPRDETERAPAAYVLHTSGSTGVPKGVAVGHRALVNLLSTMRESPGLTEKDTLVSITAPFFDISLLELLLPLTTGALLVLATDMQVREPDLLGRLLNDAEATVLQATPSGWRMLLDTGWAGRASLAAWCGGEPIDRDLANKLLERCGPVWNLYGPTETTIWSARWRVRPGTGPVLIGEPVGNTQLHVLDQHGMAVPPGVPGELYISGDGLAIGYVGQPAETARRYTTIAEGVRAYRTGDLVRRLADGSLTFLGRVDDQLKVRGHRLEPEEIEHALRAHPSVSEAVVVLTGTGQLVAHLRLDTHVPELELAALLANRFPAAITPSRFVVHEQLPYTANRKIDRKALRAYLPPASATSDAPPRTPEEHEVAAAYRDALGCGRVSRRDDYFSLGGHSLSAVAVLHRLAERTGVRIPMHTFLCDTSVAAVAAHLASGVDSAAHDRELLEALELLDSLPDVKEDR